MVLLKKKRWINQRNKKLLVFINKQTKNDFILLFEQNFKKSLFSEPMNSLKDFEKNDSFFNQGTFFRNKLFL